MTPAGEVRKTGLMKAPFITSKIGRKARTTIPKPVRSALGLKGGDRVIYRIEGARVILTRQEPMLDPFATFDEWSSEADQKAYGF